MHTLDNLRTEILLCDNDANFVAVLADYLRERGYKVTIARDGEECFTTIQSKPIDICIFDNRIPKINGAKLIEDLRKAGENLPIIIMGDNVKQEEIIRLYNAGCDAYVEKPLSVEILICKINAIIRRCDEKQNNKEKVFDFDGKIFDGERHSFDGQHLSARESDLLLLLCQNMGEVVDRHLILRALWKEDNFFASRSLSVYINHLRHILNNTNMQIIVVHKRGYKIVNCKEQT